MIIQATSSNILWTGRTLRKADGSVTLAYPGIECRFRVKGVTASARFYAASEDCWFGVQVNNEPTRKIHLSKGDSKVLLAEGLDPYKSHTIRLVRRTESWLGVARLNSVETPGTFIAPPRLPSKRLLCIGDSITCGEKTESEPPDFAKDASTWNADVSYGHILGRRLGVQVHLVSYGGRGVYRDWQGKDNTETNNAPVFFERTLPDDGAHLWSHASYMPDAIIIALGTNDFSQGVPAQEVFVTAYVEFLKHIRTLHPKAFLCIADSPITVGSAERGPSLTKYLQIIVAERVGQGDKNIAFVPVRYQPGTKVDGHPTAAQHEEIATDLEPTLRKALNLR
jgi:lysophospholipase L1-like esterase